MRFLGMRVWPFKTVVFVRSTILPRGGYAGFVLSPGAA
jgi:hypothetical protein